MKRAVSMAVAGSVLAVSQLANAWTVHPIPGVSYYELDVQPMTTRNPADPTGGIEAYNLLPFLPLPPPPAEIADPFMINGYVIMALNDEMAAGIFGAWTAGQLSTQDIADMSVGSIHSECTDIGGAYAVQGNPFPPLLFNVTDDPNEEPNLVSKCVEVVNFDGQHIVTTGLANKPAFEGNWQSCWTQPPYPVTTTLAITGGTGQFKKARGEMNIDAVQIEFPAGVCQRPGAVKRLSFTLFGW